MAEKELPKDVQEKLMHLQRLQQQIQMIVVQKQQFQLQMMETENALEELKNAKKATYKLVGEVLIEKDKKELEKELGETKEKIELRLKSIEKQEANLHAQSQKLQEELTKVLS